MAHLWEKTGPVLSRRYLNCLKYIDKALPKIQKEINLVRSETTTKQKLVLKKLGGFGHFSPLLKFKIGVYIRVLMQNTLLMI